MTGPEHYAEAERLISDRVIELCDRSQAAEAIAKAQVHATLALRVDLHEAIWALAAVVRGEKIGRAR